MNYILRYAILSVCVRASNVILISLDVCIAIDLTNLFDEVLGKGRFRVHDLTTEFADVFSRKGDCPSPAYEHFFTSFFLYIFFVIARVLLCIKSSPFEVFRGNEFIFSFKADK